MTRSQTLKLIDFFPYAPAWVKLVYAWDNAQMNNALFVQEAGNMLCMTKEETRAFIREITGEAI